jgi:hypothetical protein
MAPDFSIWLNQGLQHILSFSALDHIFYITLLSISFPIKEWKKIVILVTAFTIGHSLTLILVSFQIITIDQKWVEFLIPITIAITALLQILSKKTTPIQVYYLYILSLFFGLIHGMAYGANSIASLYNGKEMLWLIFAFNLGVEVAQICIVLIVFLMFYIIEKYLKKYTSIIKISLSSIILVYAIFLAIKHLP